MAAVASTFYLTTRHTPMKLPNNESPANSTLNISWHELGAASSNSDQEQGAPLTSLNGLAHNGAEAGASTGNREPMSTEAAACPQAGFRSLRVLQGLPATGRTHAHNRS
ncbi:MAG TPA: hypothetical protein VF690_04455 [Hymenobacter sp.]